MKYYFTFKRREGYTLVLYVLGLKLSLGGRGWDVCAWGSEREANRIRAALVMCSCKYGNGGWFWQFNINEQLIIYLKKKTEVKLGWGQYWAGCLKEFEQCVWCTLLIWNMMPMEDGLGNCILSLLNIWNWNWNTNKHIISGNIWNSTGRLGVRGGW